jgi:alpha-pyrone synthase
MHNAYINYIATATPEHDIHLKFIDYISNSINLRQQNLFKRMVARAQIDHRYSIFKPGEEINQLDGEGFYIQKPGTHARMLLYKKHAFALAKQALDQLDLSNITHLIITSCTGFYAPGLDMEIINHYKLSPKIERVIIGFMGCYAAINALKQAHHIIRSQNNSRVLIINIELCTLHLQASNNIEDLLSFLIFSDGCAASIISGEKTGIEIIDFHSTILPKSDQEITWNITDSGFDMNLSGKVPEIISINLPKFFNEIRNSTPEIFKDFSYLALHPGGRSIIDAVEKALNLSPQFTNYSREILRNYGNMSSATIMFVLKLIAENNKNSGSGCALAFGPGIAVESMLFRK